MTTGYDVTTAAIGMPDGLLA